MIKKQIKMWWYAARPSFYIATIIPIIIAYIAAKNDVGYWNSFVLTGALAICFLLHLAANLTNDVYDYLLGTDSEHTLGGSGILSDGSITVGTLKIIICALYFFVAFLTLLGFYFTKLPFLWLIVGFGMFSSFFYVAPPIKYGYRALGEVFVFLNMGTAMVLGSYYAFTGGQLSLSICFLSLPIGLMVAGILYYQSLPEIETDKANKKYTLANVLSINKAMLLFKIWWPLIWFLMLILWLINVCSPFVLLGIALCLPIHIKLCAKVDYYKDNLLILDKYGKYVRLMYLFCGLSLIVAVFYK